MLNRRWATLLVLLGLLALASIAEARVILWEDFSTSDNGSLPVGWDIVDNLGDNPIWTIDNGCLDAGYGGSWNLISYPFASADNVCGTQGYIDMDTDLISNEIDLSLFSDVSITFDADCLRYNPAAKDYIDPIAVLEVFDGTTWSPVSGYDPVDDNGGNDASYPFDISTLADGNDGFALRWNFTALTAEPDEQAGWCVIDNILVEGECPDTTAESLIVDDGTYDDIIPADGYNTAYVTCIEPSVYPSYLTEISAFFIDAPPVTAGTTDVHFAVFRGEIADGPEPLAIWEGDDFVPDGGFAGEWFSEDLTGEAVFDNPLTYGAWCLGVIAPYGTFQDQYIGIDDSISGNSWKGNLDGHYYWQSFVDLQIDGNAMIRGEAEYCVSAGDDDTTDDDTTDDDATDDDAGDDDATDDDAQDDDSDDLDDDSSASVEDDTVGGGSCDFGCN